MALNLKDPRTLRAIDELARLSGTSKSQAVASAVEARLAQLLAEHAAAPDPAGPRRERLRGLIADSSARFGAAGLGPDGEGSYADPTAALYDGDGLPG